MRYDEVVLLAARAFEIAGIVAMLLGSAAAFVRYLKDRAYHDLRVRVAHSILMGLELLVASDIIATITIRPEIRSVAALGLIVLIRTFLSFSLELEASGRWPWERGDEAAHERGDLIAQKQSIPG